LDRLIGCVARHRGGQPTAAIAEPADDRQLRAGLGEEVLSGDPEIGDAVADELDDVVGPDEEDVERVVLDARDKAAVALLEDEPGVVEEPEGRLDEAALVRDCEADPVPHRSAPAGYGVEPALVRLARRSRALR